MTMLRLTALALPFVAAFVAGGALAQDVPCTTDADCATGQLCALTDCARPCDVDIDPACEPVDCGGGTCIDAGPAPVDCSSDVDCATGERCITETFESCVGCACADGDPACDCDVPTGETCTTETVSFCLPPYQAACAIDADCGGGFTCEFLESCGCSGGGGGPGDGDAAPPAPEDPEACVCEPATEGSCVLERVECASAADCAGFECIDEGTAGVCSVDEAGIVTCDEPADSTSVCAPPGFGGGGGTGAENGLVRASEDASEDDSEDEDPIDGRPIFNCSTSSATSAVPFLALGLLLRRRRR